MINTKEVSDRRELHFSSLQDILADAERLGAAQSIRNTGNWTPAQVMQHVGRLMLASIDGFQAKGPLLFRIIGPMMKGKFLSNPFKAGFKVPDNFSQLKPDENPSWDEGFQVIKTGVERAQSGERMSQSSPFLGSMSHEDWVAMHCRHAELHFSFLHPE